MAGGAATMLAFGIGTLPGLLAATYGVRKLAGTARTSGGRLAAGLSIAVLGTATLFIAQPIAAYLCAPATHAAESSPERAASHWHLQRFLDPGQTRNRSGA
jgi:sulfite exporter TauE/SafE